MTSPHKIGEGMGSYMAYKVITNTNLSYFKKTNPEVNRRFSDFLGLRDKLCEKYLQNGRIIPPCPDKSVIGMTKVKMSKEDEGSSQSGLLSNLIRLNHWKYKIIWFRICWEKTCRPWEVFKPNSKSSKLESRSWF